MMPFDGIGDLGRQFPRGHQRPHRVHMGMRKLGGFSLQQCRRRPPPVLHQFGILRTEHLHQHDDPAILQQPDQKSLVRMRGHVRFRQGPSQASADQGVLPEPGHVELRPAQPVEMGHQLKSQCQRLHPPGPQQGHRALERGHTLPLTGLSRVGRLEQPRRQRRIGAQQFGEIANARVRVLRELHDPQCQRGAGGEFRISEGLFDFPLHPSYLTGPDR
jgi:hypothetical protein